VRLLRGKVRAVLNDLRGTANSPDGLTEPLREQWARILRRSPGVLRSLPPPTGPRVLFALAHGLGGARLCIESILAMALRLRGVDVHYLACDKALPACEFNEYGNSVPPVPPEFGPALSRLGRLEKCRICTENIFDAFELLPLKGTTFSQFLRPDDLARAEEVVAAVRYEDYRDLVYHDIHVGEHAYASMLRATLRGTLLDDAQTRWMYRRFLVSVVMIAELTERVFQQARPERVVAAHGVYATHGTICEAARKFGAGVVVHGIPYRKGTIWLSHQDTYHRTLITEPTSLWDRLELTPERAARVDGYLAAKRLGGRDYAAYHANALNEREAIERELNLDSTKPLVSLYTNVLWDAQLYYSANAFANMLEWLYATIRYFARRPDLQLAVRLHPAEARGAMPTQQPLKEEIAREFPELPANVRVVTPESRVSSYTLAEMSAAALIYGARMGVEIAILGTPLIIAGETFNRRKGYSYDVETPEEYFRLLDRVPNLPRNSEEMVHRARLYAYHFLYRLMIDLPLFSVSDGIHLGDPRLAFETLEALMPGSCPALDAICQGLADGTTPFIYDPSEAAAGSAAIPQPAAG
jgi:hypothetical protein